MKEENVVYGEVSIPSVVLARIGDEQRKTVDIPVAAGAYLEMQSVKISISDGSYLTASGEFTSQDQVVYRYVIKRKDATHYQLEARVMNMTSFSESRTTLAFTVSAKIHLFVPSTQQQ